MDFTVGAIVEGKVKSITKFGAFISLPGGKTGMVHISEIAHAYVSDIHEHLTEGQDVKVMVIAVDPAGKINLSIKRTLAPQPRSERASRPSATETRRTVSGGNAQKKPPSFDEMLKQFMSDSDSKIASVRQYADHKSRTRRR